MDSVHRVQRASDPESGHDRLGGGPRPRPGELSEGGAVPEYVRDSTTVSLEQSLVALLGGDTQCARERAMREKLASEHGVTFLPKPYVAQIPRNTTDGLDKITTGMTPVDALTIDRFFAACQRYLDSEAIVDQHADHHCRRAWRRSMSSSPLDGLTFREVYEYHNQLRGNAISAVVQLAALSGEVLVGHNHPQAGWLADSAEAIVAMMEGYQGMATESRLDVVATVEETAVRAFSLVPALTGQTTDAQTVRMTAYDPRGT